MEKTKYLRKFNYDPSTFDKIKDKLVTWDGRKVEIAYVLNTNKLLSIIHNEDYEYVTQYTFDGKEVLPSSLKGDSDLYVDESIELWVNLSLSSDGHIISSKIFYSESEALKNRKDEEFDTVSFKTVSPIGIPPRINEPELKFKSDDLLDFF
jgi:hypothetical protein